MRCVRIMKMKYCRWSDSVRYKSITIGQRTVNLAAFAPGTHIFGMDRIAKSLDEKGSAKILYQYLEGGATKTKGTLPGAFCCFLRKFLLRFCRILARCEFCKEQGKQKRYANCDNRQAPIKYPRTRAQICQ